MLGRVCLETSTYIIDTRIMGSTMLIDVLRDDGK